MDGIIDSVDVSLIKLQEMEKVREAWRAAVHGVAELDIEQLNNNKLLAWEKSITSNQEKLWPIFIYSTHIYCCFSVAKSCQTLCSPMNYSMPGSPVLHCLPEFAQIHVHWVGDAIQPPHPLPLLSPLTFCLSQHQRVSIESTLHIRWSKY